MSNDAIKALDNALTHVNEGRRGFLKTLLIGSAAVAVLPLMTSSVVAQDAQEGQGDGKGDGTGEGKGDGKGGGKGKGGKGKGGKGKGGGGGEGAPAPEG